jgi:endogenous inhibitor of DNA gyrase (YacG/DUF329 family)
MVRPQTCPICNKELVPAAPEGDLFPFCSQRCKQADLYRWMRGDYAIVEPLRLHEDDPRVVEDEPQ